MAISESRTIKYLKSFYLRDYLTIFVGLVSYAVGITGFIMPNGIVTIYLKLLALLLKLLVIASAPQMIQGIMAGKV